MILAEKTSSERKTVTRDGKFVKRIMRYHMSNLRLERKRKFK